MEKPCLMFCHSGICVRYVVVWRGDITHWPCERERGGSFTLVVCACAWGASPWRVSWSKRKGRELARLGAERGVCWCACAWVSKRKSERVYVRFFACARTALRGTRWTRRRTEFFFGGGRWESILCRDSDEESWSVNRSVADTSPVPGHELELRAVLS